MSLNTDHIRLIFGLKLKQIRQERNLSLSDLSQKSGLSMSYINEIEKGKKYPKTDKISALAEALGIEYDTLVSLKLSKKLEPISQLLNSNFLTEIPFDFFGIDPANLLEMLSDAPTKLSAFINTVIKIGRSYSMSVEQFYFAVLRSYQEMHDNNFPELEEQTANFLTQFKLSEDHQIDEFLLGNLLSDRYGISINYFDEEDHPTIANIRSVYIPKTKTLMINKRISSDQRAFTLGRELGFLYMNLKERPMTSSWIEVNSFEEVFNNFKASYFAGAILIRREKLVSRLRNFFELEKFSAKAFQEMISGFQATPETLLHRISNVLPDFFGIDNVFFLRFEAPVGSKTYSLTKEMHLSKQHDPQESKNENYCRRWISLKILDDLSAVQWNKKYTQPLIDVQISDYIDAKNKYFVISVARPLNILEQTNVSVTLGFQIDQKLRDTIKFLNDPAIVSLQVNQTCEKCGLFDCKERVAAPTILQKRRHRHEMIKAINNLK
jgi:transcriptional regulator with XRE-family HTH domain